MWLSVMALSGWVAASVMAVWCGGGCSGFACAEQVFLSKEVTLAVLGRDVGCWWFGCVVRQACEHDAVRGVVCLVSRRWMCSKTASLMMGL